MKGVNLAFQGSCERLKGVSLAANPTLFPARWNHWERIPLSPDGWGDGEDKNSVTSPCLTLDGADYAQLEKVFRSQKEGALYIGKHLTALRAAHKLFISNRKLPEKRSRSSGENYESNDQATSK